MSMRAREFTLGVFELGQDKVEVSIRQGDMTGLARLSYLDPDDPAEIGVVAGLDVGNPKLRTRMLLPHRERLALIERTAYTWNTALEGTNA
ncbi:hypothetical protein [Natronoglycomyces albus]|uniref:Uncharacterized protein n=1 Tax=Natronoglycomyces albus TaxID=2811108 RepID=A0A895XTA7_9ACTN|nr:hypothetical protein [Natronoglycomyces albus]QSB06515.1 hypothetical protein JQS30_06320 [Natronoglycomyces albus]